MQILYMLRRLTNISSYFWSQASVIRQAIELLDNFIAFIDHVTSISNYCQSMNWGGKKFNQSFTYLPDNEFKNKRRIISSSQVTKILILLKTGA